MTKADLVDLVHERVGSPKKEACEVIEAVFAMIAKACATVARSKISGFGTFIVNHKHARCGRNPQTGAAITICSRRVLSFKPSQILKDRVKGDGIALERLVVIRLLPPKPHGRPHYANLPARRGSNNWTKGRKTTKADDFPALDTRCRTSHSSARRGRREDHGGAAAGAGADARGGRVAMIDSDPEQAAGALGQPARATAQGDGAPGPHRRGHPRRPARGPAG